MKKRIEGKNKVLVLPEGDDIRILGAASRLNKENLCKPLLLGDSLKIKELAKEGRAILIVTHDIKFANDISNRVIEIKK